MFELVFVPSWHYFRNPEALDPRLCLVYNVQQWMEKTLEELLQDTAWKSGCEYCLKNIAWVCNFLYHRGVKCALSYFIRSDQRMLYSPYAFYQD